MNDDRWWRDFDQLVTAFLPSGSRVLDLGCADGGLVDRLDELGFDSPGVDPTAPSHPRLIQERIEHASGLTGFDAVTSVMALHRAELDTVVQALGNVRRPGGWLFAYDYRWDAYNEQAAEWIRQQSPSLPKTTLSGWRREHCELHTVSIMHQALSARFEPVLEVRRPFLARVLASGARKAGARPD